MSLPALSPLIPALLLCIVAVILHRRDQQKTYIPPRNPMVDAAVIAVVFTALYYSLGWVMRIAGGRPFPFNMSTFGLFIIGTGAVTFIGSPLRFAQTRWLAKRDRIDLIETGARGLESLWLIGIAALLFLFGALSYALS